MAKYLIVYGTEEGQTAKISQRIAEVITQEGHEVDVYDARKLPESLSIEGYAGVLVGSSIHMLQWSAAAHRFVCDNRARLDGVPSAFFSVSGAASSDDPKSKSIANLNSWVQKFFDTTGWHPKKTVNFAGSIAYTKYSFFTKLLQIAIAYSTNGPTDTSKDWEFTNWDNVTEFAKDFVQESQQAFSQDHAGLAAE